MDLVFGLGQFWLRRQSHRKKCRKLHGNRKKGWFITVPSQTYRSSLAMLYLFKMAPYSS